MEHRYRLETGKEPNSQFPLELSEKCQLWIREKCVREESAEKVTRRARKLTDRNKKAAEDEKKISFSLSKRNYFPFHLVFLLRSSSDEATHHLSDKKWLVKLMKLATLMETSNPPVPSSGLPVCFRLISVVVFRRSFPLLEGCRELIGGSTVTYWDR